MEVLRGGSSPIFSNGQPGLTVNFIQKKGQDEPEGSVRLTGGNNALRRIDVFNSGPMGNGWYYSIGGFFRETDGVRDPQFSADKGGQFSATLSKRWDSGELSFYARHTDDNNAFYTAIPLLSRNNGNDLSSFPGLNAQTGTLLGRDFRNVDLVVGPNGETIQRDLADGRGVNIDVFGGELNWDVGGWTVADRFNVMAGTAPTYALFTGDAPQRLGDFIAGYGTTGSGRFTNGFGAVDPNQQVLEAGWWSVDKRLNSFTNDLRLSRELFAGNTLTVGAYYAKYSSADTWYLGNTMLLTAQNNARRIDVDLADGRQATRQGLPAPRFSICAPTTTARTSPPLSPTNGNSASACAWTWVHATSARASPAMCTTPPRWTWMATRPLCTTMPPRWRWPAPAASTRTMKPSRGRPA